MDYIIDYDNLAIKINEKLSKQSSVNENQTKKKKVVLIQAPDGLKTELIKIVKELESRTKAEYVTLVEPAWGSCDLADEKAIKLQCDLLVHIGHNMIYPGKLPTIFWTLTPNINIQPILEELIVYLQEQKLSNIGLIASSQFTNFIPKIIEVLKEKNITSSSGQGTSRVKDIGQVLGCNYTIANTLPEDIQAIVYFGDGIFHPIGIAFTTKKRIITCDPYAKIVKELSNERDLFIRQRFAILSQCAKAEKFGIIVSVKNGQLYLQKAKQLKKLIESKGKQAFILICDFVYPDYFLGLDVDCYVNTACPRLAIEDFQKFNKLMINPKELEIALNERKLNNYEFEELLY